MPYAARQGDLTTHGGVIASGFETVLIEGLPAARLADNHLCPMCNPGTPPIPHVGGPIAQGSTSVLIGGSAAARVGDVCTCIGPPDCIAQGSTSVIIGDASDAGANSSGSENTLTTQASHTAQTALLASSQNNVPAKHWIEYQVVDESDNPISGLPFQCLYPGDDESSTGRLSHDGKLKRNNMTEPGDGCLQLNFISNIQWSTDQAQLGENVTLSATITGAKNNSVAIFTIYDSNASEVVRIETKVQNEQVQADWTYSACIEASSNGHVYFDLQCENLNARSPLLRYIDWIEFIIPNAENHIGDSYSLTLSNGVVKQGQLSQDGIISVKDISPGPISIVFSDGQQLTLAEQEG